ncbi:hypothetical protein KIN20_033162 [Parelaphostrongylus tenuis]|uniref:Uncharacterized protein n=1 Tax=Parelaphostrongylus tenuis TaxID=148309 RepID=A0AAD5R7J7_PARTN|nr:hypothetical protein KIN20_033162 [Parelaphostrongylus tenuis]
MHKEPSTRSSVQRLKDMCPGEQRFDPPLSFAPGDTNLKDPVTSTLPPSHLASRQRKAACRQIDREEVDRTGA